jgi:hypothetical protein
LLLSEKRRLRFELQLWSADGVWEQGDEENVETEEARDDRRLEKTA